VAACWFSTTSTQQQQRQQRWWWWLGLGWTGSMSRKCGRAQKQTFAQTCKQASLLQPQHDVFLLDAQGLTSTDAVAHPFT
jgi:hypothetical protein